MSFEALYEERRQEGALKGLRAKAWERFLQLGLPTKKSEVFKYLRLGALEKRSYGAAAFQEVAEEAVSEALLPECRDSCFVFVNGLFRPELSRTSALPKNLVALPLERACRTYGTFLNNHWTKMMEEEKDPFAALNGALHQEGLFLYLPPKTAVEAPVQILHLIHAGEEPMLLLPRLHLFAGKHSEMRLIANEKVISGREFTCSQVMDFAIEEEGSVTLTQIGFDSDPWHFAALRALMKRNSRFKCVAATDGGESRRHDYHLLLCGEGGEAELDGVWMLADRRECHTNILIDHQAPHCRSRQMFKGVLSGLSRSSFEGKIYVRQKAQQTDAFQLNNNLILSEGAQANSKPNLEIFADDVKASHGATTGQLNDEELFYMRARGFSEAQAKNLLIQGFCKEVIERVELPTLQKALMERAEEYVV